MADEKLAELLKTQKSLTEWLEDIKHSDVEELRREDNEKRERLKILNEVIGLPFDKPVQFEADDLAKKTSMFISYLNDHGDELCALRLIPKEEGLPKLRMRGKSVIDAYKWFLEQDIDVTKYRADFIPHPPDYSWATIFVVNKHGIQGEMVKGGHHQLTFGLQQAEESIAFHYDFHAWKVSPPNKEAEEHLKEVVKYLHVDNLEVQKRLQQELEATFSHNYINGYFESTDSSLGTWFIDYNRRLGKMYSNVNLTIPAKHLKSLVSGRSGSRGTATGPVRIISVDLDVDFPVGAVLVCEATTPNHVPLMKRAAAIVTDQGGILSHAAIVAREMGKPCIVGTGNATTVLKDAQMVFVDADKAAVFEHGIIN